MPIRHWGAAKVGPVSRDQALIAARAKLLAFQAQHEGVLGVDLSGMIRAFDDAVEAAASSESCPQVGFKDSKDSRVPAS